MSTIRFTGINHLAMVTRDMDMTIRFWRDLLGMRLVAGLGKASYRHYFFEISPHDMIAFFEWPDVETPKIKDHGVPVKGPVMFDHVSLEVENDDALWALKDKLETTEIWVSDVIDHGFIHSIYTFDPNNIPIEFSAPVKGVDVRAHPRMKDSRPTKSAQEGPDPHPGHWPEPPRETPEEEKIIFQGEGKILVEE